MSSTHRPESCTWLTIWPPPPLLPMNVHVWIINLDNFTQGLTLSSDEKRRANQFLHVIDRHRWIAGREAMRKILGAYLGLLASEIRLGYGPAGKPYLINNSPLLAFNFTHSSNLALLALHPTGPIGIDLELQRSLVDLITLAEISFSPREFASWQSLAMNRREEGFYRCWVSKEAIVKALGLGLGEDLTTFDVSVDPDIPPRLLADHMTPHRIATWELLPVPVAKGWIATMALPSPVFPPQFFTYLPSCEY